MEDSYREMLEWELTGNAPTPDFSHVSELLRQRTEPTRDDSLILGAKIGFDVRDTVFLDYPKDIRCCGLGFIRKTDALVGILRVGHKLDRRSQINNSPLSIENDLPYSPELVAVCSAFTVGLMLELPKASDFRKFLRFLRVPPVWRDYKANKV